MWLAVDEMTVDESSWYRTHNIGFHYLTAKKLTGVNLLASDKAILTIALHIHYLTVLIIDVGWILLET